MSKIHSTAIIEDGASIGENCEIGAFSIIGSEVQLGDNCKVHANVQIKNKSIIGNNNTFFHGCIIGEIPQDFTFDNLEGKVVIGNNNTYREFTSVHLPVRKDRETVIGNDNYFMVGVHLGHDVQVGNKNIIVNNTALGGHVEVADNTYISALCGIHQFVHIGSFAAVAPLSKPAQDIPPFIMADGAPAKAHGLNLVAMKRGGIKPEARKQIKATFKLLFYSKMPVKKALLEIKSSILSDSSIEKENLEYVQEMVDFCESSSRGIISSSYN